MLHIPLLRAGQIYYSLSKVELLHSQTQEPMAIVSQANPGLIARDFMSMSKNQRTLDSLSIHDLIRICQRAGQYFIMMICLSVISPNRPQVISTSFLPQPVFLKPFVART